MYSLCSKRSIQIVSHFENKVRGMFLTLGKLLSVADFSELVGLCARLNQRGRIDDSEQRRDGVNIRSGIGACVRSACAIHQQVLRPSYGHHGTHNVRGIFSNRHPNYARSRVHVAHGSGGPWAPNHSSSGRTASEHGGAEREECRTIRGRREYRDARPQAPRRRRIRPLVRPVRPGPRHQSLLAMLEARSASLLRSGK